jgi:hypothetical protein
MEEASPTNSTLVDLGLWLIMLVIILGLGIPYLSKGNVNMDPPDGKLTLPEAIPALQYFPNVCLAPAQLMLEIAYNSIVDDRILGFEKLGSPGDDLTQPIAPLQTAHKLVPQRQPERTSQSPHLTAIFNASSSAGSWEQAGSQTDKRKAPGIADEDNVKPSSSSRHCRTASVGNAPAKSGTRSQRLFDSIIHRAARRYQVDPYLVKAIIMAESSYNPRAISKKGAKGLMQLMPRTAKALGVEDSFNPENNIDAGVKYFKQLLNQFDGDVKLALAAYNAGSKKVRKYNGVPPFKATQYYVKKVFEYHERYRQ